MRLSVLLILLVTNFTIAGQEFHDILKYQDKYYLMDRNPTGESNPYEEGLNFWYGCEYIINNDSLVISDILKVNKRFKDSTKQISVGDFQLLSGEVNLVEILNYKRTRKEVSRKGVFHSVYNDHWTVDFWELRYKQSLYFENGILIKGRKMHNDSLYLGNYGYVQFSQSNDISYLIRIYSKDESDSLVFEIESDEFHYAISKQYNFPTGAYELKVIGEDNSVLIKDINVKSNNLLKIYPDDGLNNVVTDRGVQSIDVYLNNDNNYIKSNLNYGNNKIYQLDSIEVNQFSFSSFWGNERFLDVVNNVSFNYNVGGGYSFCLVHPENNRFSQQSTKINTYSYLFGSIDLGFRLYFSRHKKVYQNRSFLELGANYQLPVVFRNIQRFDKMKISHNRLHNYKDFSFYSMIGITNGIGLNAEYRLFDIVKNNFPQMPKIQIGLSLQFQN